MPQSLPSRQSLVMLGLLSLVLAAALLALADERGRLRGAAPERQRSLQEVDRALSLQIIRFDSETGSSSYMIDAPDGRLASAGEAIRGAVPVTAEADETFTRLLVFYFGASDTVELSFSPGRNLVIADGVTYAPSADLGELLGDALSE